MRRFYVHAVLYRYIDMLVIRGIQLRSILYLCALMTIFVGTQGLPTQWEWWMIQALSFVLMATAGEYFCAMKELQDIPLYERTLSGSSEDNL